MSALKTIFLVDDDETFVEATKIVLEQNYNVETAKNGKECLEKVNGIDPDIIILDIMMSHLGEGLDVAKKLKQESSTKNIPLIMLTGVDKVYDTSMNMDKSEIPHDLWLEKPVESDELIKKIESLL